MGDRHDRARLCARPQISAETNSVQTTTGVPRESCSPCQSLVDYANTKITQHAAKNKQTKKRVKRSEPARVRRIASLVCCHLRHRVRHPLRRSFLVRHCRPTYRLLHPLRRPFRPLSPVRRPPPPPPPTPNVLVSRCDTAVLRTASSTLYDVPSIVLVPRCDTAVLRTSSSLSHNIPSTVLFPRSAQHASHDTTGKCKL